MATKKSSAKKSTEDSSVALKVTGNAFRVKDVLGKFLVLQKISAILSIIFYLIWIPVGIFFIWFIFANFKLGAFDQLMQSPASPTGQESAVQEAQTPAETTVPGVGKVNVDCVQSNLSEEAIIKMVQDKGVTNLTEEEKTKLQPCIVEAESSEPASE